MAPRQLFTAFMRDSVGLPYIYGANGPEMYDCSGVVCAALRAAGMQIGDHSAQDLYAMFKDRTVPEFSREGQLFFYRDDPVGPVTHVMVGTRYWGKGRGWLVGARGGGSTTLSVDMAWAAKACVDLVRCDYWQDARVAICDPLED